MEPAYYTNFGDAAIRYGEVPSIIGVLEAPDNHMPIGMAFPIGWTAEGRALYRLVVGGEEIPERWVCRARRFVLPATPASVSDPSHPATRYRCQPEDVRAHVSTTLLLRPAHPPPLVLPTM
jgi:hypothetical protein